MILTVFLVEVMFGEVDLLWVLCVWVFLSLSHGGSSNWRVMGGFVWLRFSLMQMVPSLMVFLLGSADVFASVFRYYVPFTLKFLVGKCFCWGFAST